MNTLNKTAGKAEKAPVPRGEGWEDPNQKWSGMWLFAVLMMIPIDAVVAYFTRNWGIFQWVPGLILGGYTLQFFLNIFIPTKADLRTAQQKRAAEQSTPNGRSTNQSGTPWSLVPGAIRGGPAGNFYTPFDDDFGDD